MKVNFKIIENYALEFDGCHIDLHNNFDFVGFEYFVSNRKLKLSWAKRKTNLLDENEFNKIVLVHKEITFFIITHTSQDEKLIFEDDKCLSEITFFPSTERDVNNHFLIQEKPNNGDDIIYSFENDQRIRVHCEEIELLF